MTDELQKLIGTGSQAEISQLESFYFITYRPNNVRKTVSLYIDEGDYSLLLKQSVFLQIVELLCGVSVANKVGTSFQESEWFKLDRENKTVKALSYNEVEEKLTALTLKKEALASKKKDKDKISVPCVSADRQIRSSIESKAKQFARTRFFSTRY